MRLKALLASLLLLLPLSFNAFAQNRLSDQAKITLLTCGPGEELYSVFGHTAIRIFDPINGIDVVCNYGTFDFNTPNFYLKFVKGDLQYMLSTSSYEDFVYTYKYYNRDVFEQELNLTTAQKQQIATELQETLQSDKRFYTYKFIDRNCTTMAGDLINKYAPNKISMENSDKGKTNRRIIFERLNNSFYESLGINLLFGYKTDKEMDRLFLPDQLMQGLANTKTADGHLAQPAITIYKSTAEKRISVWNNFYTYAALCLLLMITASRKALVRRSYLAITGLLGLLFCFMGMISLHSELLQNYNALLFNPFFLVLLVFIFTKKQKAAIATSYICLVCIAIYLGLMVNKPHLIMMLPLIAVTVVVLLKVLKDVRQSNVKI
ncbi:hypothetical protein HYN59_08415 [Flavobacterium album]|uniref:Uncharacterized protein n=1 Tax=Flavobacterium album TaxID=2175091 RepID=A0A2S1QXM7_9FLAO|nr:DUF4105 domain-containing protein [Flavobacterium album]AWH85143.1 hypothetical protein HYN59_08415 [Flavobacterium album]